MRQSSVKIKTIGYWTATALLGFAWITGGAAYVLRLPGPTDGLLQMGYPAFFVTILGFWKLAGAAVILAPRLPLLKEWAYAGTIFELTGAIASQALTRDSVWHLISPGFFAVCAIVSWALRPTSRRLILGGGGRVPGLAV
jgi:hypothetical protein